MEIADEAAINLCALPIRPRLQTLYRPDQPRAGALPKALLRTFGYGLEILRIGSGQDPSDKWRKHERILKLTQMGYAE